MNKNTPLISKLTILFFNQIDQHLSVFERCSARNTFEFAGQDGLSDMELIQISSITREEVADMAIKINDRLDREYLQGWVVDYHGSKGVVIDEEIRKLPREDANKSLM
ncbi:hypothetical protein [Shewanella colwelliana]|uniref:hypothetical protein n=1 Tax=Shewanella colwelliana TaxID=23 RepID=UPI0022AE8EEA|nr:hypothetical protein [Shewanella colwelliana]MCZ4339920.1 hypothetical protein [Shewanella colwelliana]